MRNMCRFGFRLSTRDGLIFRLALFLHFFKGM